MKKLIEDEICECRFSTPSEYSARSFATARITMGNSPVALLIRRGVPAQWGSRRITACYPCDKPAVEMKEP